MALNNPHDKLFKKIFKRINEAISFFQGSLPGEIVELIDWKTLGLVDDYFISEKLDEFYSDILDQVDISGKNGFSYLLFDHKSSADQEIQFQLLKYQVFIRCNYINKHPK